MHASPLSAPSVPPVARRRMLARLIGLAGWAFAGAPARSALAQSAAEDALWRLSLPQPDGTPLALQSLRGKPLIVNFWATWCPPCVKEMPLLDQFHKQQAHTANGWQVVGIAVDSAAKVQAFVQRLELGFPILVAGPKGLELAKSLGGQGPLPFTVVIGADGRVLERKAGMVQPEDLARWQTL